MRLQEKKRLCNLALITIVSSIDNTSFGCEEIMNGARSVKPKFHHMKYLGNMSILEEAEADASVAIRTHNNALEKTQEIWDKVCHSAMMVGIATLYNGYCVKMMGLKGRDPETWDHFRWWKPRLSAREIRAMTIKYTNRFELDFFRYDFYSNEISKSLMQLKEIDKTVEKSHKRAKRKRDAGETTSNDGRQKKKNKRKIRRSPGNSVENPINLHSPV